MPYYRQANIWPKANIYLWHKATYDIDMTQDTPSRSLDKVIVRLPDGMRDRIREAAEKNNRSMNAEIVSRLEASLTDASTSPKQRVAKFPDNEIMGLAEYLAESLLQKAAAQKALTGKGPPSLADLFKPSTTPTKVDK